MTAEESLAGLASRQQPVVATHYTHPDDERSLTGVGPNAGKEDIDQLYAAKAVNSQSEDL